MPWKSGYTVSTERAVLDEDVRWPDGARCQLSVTIDLSPICGPGGITAQNLDTPETYFGLNGGIESVRAVLASHRVRATVAVPGVIAEVYPQLVRALRDDGHEIAAHCYAHEDVSMLDRGEEHRRLRCTTAALQDVTGQRPRGWYSLPRAGDKFAGGSISDSTVALLLEEGYEYLGNSTADDRPHYWIVDPDEPRGIVALPYYYHFDDQFFLLFPARGTGLENADALERNWRAELAAQYQRGLIFHMTIHPHAIAWPHRIELLDAFLAHARALPALANATGGEVAEHWRLTQPLTTEQVVASVWRDHEDSLS